MLNHLEKYTIILASNSPRRQELLSELGVEYIVRPLPSMDESYPSHLKGGEIVKFIAHKKAKSYESVMDENDLIITADTIVYFNGEALGKPKDKETALTMLSHLSGNIHEVFTGVCLKTKKQTISFVARTEVKFASLSTEEIEYYIEKYKPYDKAGSYGIQEWIGYIGVENISGSFYNVMGLPMHKLYTELKNIE